MIRMGTLAPLSVCGSYRSRPRNSYSIPVSMATAVWGARLWCVRVSVRESDTVDLDASTVWAFGESVGRGRGGMSRGKLTLGTSKFGTLRTAFSGIANSTKRSHSTSQSTSAAETSRGPIEEPFPTTAFRCVRLSST